LAAIDFVERFDWLQHFCCMNIFQPVRFR